MKTINKIILSIVLLLAVKVGTVKAQGINWTELAEGKKHFVTLNFGVDNSSYYGLSYGYKIGKTDLPLMVDAAFEIPFGREVFDDWSSRVGLQYRLWNHNNLWWSARASVIFRKYESDVADLLNFGSGLSTLFGYQKPHWGVAGEFSYERSEVTKIKNHLLVDYYPEITDGWYNTPGGNFKFGLQANARIKTVNLFVHSGVTFGQDFENNPTLPFYAKVGINKSF